MKITMIWKKYLLIVVPAYLCAYMLVALFAHHYVAMFAGMMSSILVGFAVRNRDRSKKSSNPDE